MRLHAPPAPPPPFHARRSVLNEALFHEPLLEAGPATASTSAPGLVLVRDIDFASLSADSLLPFHGVCHIAYVPAAGVVLGLSKLARLTRLYAKRLQTQPALTQQVLGALMATLQPQGAAVIVQARHMSLSRRQQPAQLTACAAGSFVGSDLTMEVLAMLGLDPLEVHVCPLGACSCRAAAAAAADCSASSQPTLPAGGGASNPTTCSSSSSSSTGGGQPRLVGISASAPHAPQPQQQPPGCRGGGPPPADEGDGPLPLAPTTPDPSEISDSEASEQEQPSCSSSCPTTALPSSLNGLEAAVASLLAEAGLASQQPPLAAATRAYVLSMLASTSGAHQELTREGLRQQRARAAAAEQQQQQQQQPQPSPPLLAPASLRTWQQWALVEHHLPFASQCEHHLLPFYGTLHIACLLLPPPAAAAGEDPGAGGWPASALSDCEVDQVVTSFTQRLQLQERITQQVADAVAALTGAAGVLVCCRAAHMCMVARGVENHAGSTVTRAAVGEAASPAAAPLRNRFLLAAQRMGGGGGAAAAAACGCCQH